MREGRWFRQRVVWTSTWRLRLLACVAVAGLFLLPHAWWLQALAGGLVREDAPGPADVIVVELFEHPSPAVFAHAARLRDAGIAPRVAVTRYQDSPRLAAAGITLTRRFDDVLRVHWQDAGLPDAAVEIVPVEVRDPVTLNLARQIAEYCRARGYRRVALVASRFHSRRSAASLERFGGGLTVLSLPPASGLTAGNWWTTKDGILTVLQEAVRLAYYRVVLLR
jgi:uncharacterized SAM-binding protein YcdF (DUF218 family)